MNLQEIRERLSELDRQMLALVAERQRLSREVAEAKQAEGKGTRDYTREREVVMRARATAESLGISPALAEQVMRLLIRGSLTTQERIRVVAGGRGGGKTALIIGGTGKMGRWFSDFMASQGYTVTVADPARRPDNAAYAYIADWRESALDYDLIVVATPLKIANVVLQELAERKPRGIVFDIGSLKTPLRQGIDALKSAGVKVTSVHPMFGPDTELLSGRHVIFIDVGNKEAVTAAQELFGSTMAQQAVMGLDEHDRLIAYVLGLSHALNISFFTALAESGEAAPRLAQLSSTTYDAQVDVATRVAAESPDLYFEIQHLNDYGRESLLALRKAVEKLWHSVSTGDAPEFTAMMQQGREYLAGRVRND
ncbi:prephenate dehydrogenase/arogenate dehydrogenase family protein [Peristeroidobacter soli]|jgi:chorismate mutase/prephenate dehydrogenase|uniref:prephenate dehydrogenase/arogenate dehydrogenase family protein n=1 Tax=Peristeroidobacter soli TaxID=2497877 RepID=UPI00158AAD15|nr:prephenate dehydrogenase/arogenate dehydrogenase family protein [Peristeroidobacter soli]